jgi:alkylation response protein AidB-like acyl-CoA dehydrogenase
MDAGIPAQASTGWEMDMETSQEFCERMERLGRRFAAGSEDHDRDDSFVSENFAALKEEKIFSALIPKELGGGGISHRTMCQVLRIMARHCGATALSLSMHQHLAAFQTWNHMHGKPVGKFLEKVAAGQLVLISTGANDWLASSGNAVKTDGGYKVTARKSFASGSPSGDFLMTSAPCLDPAEGWQVLHFPVPFTAPGLSLVQDWKTMGMRGTGSNSISLENVFVPEEAVGLRRPRGTFHPVFCVITTLALPLIVSVYVGVAEAAARIARDQAKRRTGDPTLPYLIGEMENRLAAAQIAMDSMIAIANDYDFTPSVETSSAILIRKTLAVNAALAAGEKALEAMGGSGYFRSAGLERLIRDLHAGQFHPLPEKRQQSFTGRVAMGMDPVEPAFFPATTEISGH